MYLISIVWITFLVIVISGVSSSSNDGTYCDGTGWEAYHDEKCYKLIKEWASRDLAKSMCAQEEAQADGSIPQLVTIKSSDEQTYLTELVFNKSVVAFNVWIGLKRQNGNKLFIWDDDSDVVFTNWAEGNPTDSIQQNCVVMKPEYMKSGSQGTTAGQWRDVPCEMPNYVICEKLPRWSTTKLQQTLLETKKELKSSNDLLSKELENTKNQLTDALENTKNQLSKELEGTKNQLASTINELSITKNELSQSTARLGIAETKIEETKDKLIPIGFLYTQLPNEKAPSQIWPEMIWQDVSSVYAGVFFRVEGGGSGQFGQVQAQNTQRLSAITTDGSLTTCSRLYSVGTVIGGWSQSVYAGPTNWDGGNLCLKFQMSDGEIRPKNVAIRVWRRIA